MTKKGWTILQASIFFPTMIGMFLCAFFLHKDQEAVVSFFNEQKLLLYTIIIYLPLSFAFVIAMEMAKRRNDCGLSLKSILTGLSVVMVFYTYFWLTR